MAERVGRYRLEGVIGAGSFATVHRAVDELLDDVVVVKLLAENHSLNPEVRERFIGEGRSLRKVHSPHVITVHDIGESDRQQPYLVLQHADRGTLATRVASLRAGGWAPNRDDVLVVARSLASAVEAVHRAHLVHRDLSPGNVLLTSAPEEQRVPETTTDALGGATVVAPGERLLVADLGMCKDLAMNSGLTVAGGTSGFRPPEQDGPGLIDTRADLWAMSALLWWLCEAGGIDLPQALFTVLARGTATDPAHRHPDVAAWLADVEEALAPPPPPPPPAPLPSAPAGAHGVPGAGGGHGEPGAHAASGAPGVPHPRPRRLRLGLIALLSLLVVGVAGFIGGLRFDDGPPAQSGDAVIAIEGPEQLVVGEQATFTAATEGVNSWVWTLPTGAHIVDEPTTSMTATTPGSARVILQARAPDGTDLETVHHLTVVE